MAKPEVQTQPEFDFTASDFLSSQGLSIKAVDKSGMIQAVDKDGKEYDFDPKEYLKSQGVDPSKVALSVNTPESALPESPVSIRDRLALSLGNKKGNISFLKNKFEDAQYNDKTGLTVKEGGVWKKVDPNQLGGDPWSISEAIADGLEAVGSSGLQIMGSMIGAAVGGAGGTAAAPGAGTAVGGYQGAGIGAAAGETLRTYLGRYVGTYEASATEQIKDIAIEGLMAAGMQAAAPGIKPLWQDFTGAMSKIGKTASEGTKNLLAATYGKLTNAGAPATKILMEEGKEVTKKILALKAAGASSADDIIHMGAESQVKSGQEFLETATKALPKKYGELLQKVIESPKAAKMAVNVGEVVDSSKKAIVDGGFGTIDSLGNLRPLTPSQIASRLSQGQEIELSKDAIKGVREVVGVLNQFSKVGELKGPAAVKALNLLHTALNRVHQDALGNGANKQLARALGQAVAGFKNGLGQQFEKAGLNTEYSALSALYGKYGDAVANARGILARDGVEGFVNKLLSSAGKGVQAKGEAGLLAELGGEQTQKLYKDILITETAKRFAPIAPKFGLLQSVASGAGSAALMTGTVSTPVGVAVASQMSPALVRGQFRAAQAVAGGAEQIASKLVPYAAQTVDFIKRLTPDTLKMVLKDERFLAPVMSQALQSMYDEDNITNTILQKSGVANGQ